MASGLFAPGGPSDVDRLAVVAGRVANLQQSLTEWPVPGALLAVADAEVLAECATSLLAVAAGRLRSAGGHVQPLDAAAAVAATAADGLCHVLRAVRVATEQTDGLDRR